MINSILLIQQQEEKRKEVENQALTFFPYAKIKIAAALTMPIHAFYSFKDTNQATEQHDLILIDCREMDNNYIEKLEQLKDHFPERFILIKRQSTHTSLNDNLLDRYSHLFPSVGQVKVDESPDESDSWVDDLHETCRLYKALSQQPIQVDNWQPQKLLHSSPQAAVYLARSVQHYLDLAVIKTFAVIGKTLSAEHSQTFMREVEHLKNINSPNIVSIKEAGISQNTPYIVMDYVGEKTLKDIIEDHHTLTDLSTKLHYFLSTLEAVQALHQHKQLHRDIKPSNIIPQQDGSIILIDCGIENNWLINTGQIDEHEAYCTPYYASPERTAGEACTIASEIYSLGILFYELLTHSKPYDGQSLIDLIKAHALSPIPCLPSFASQYQDFFEKLLAKHPDDRYQSIDDALSAFLHDSV